MYIELYEISAATTSLIIVITSIYILCKDHNYMIIFIILSGFLSCLTRLYRIKETIHKLNDKCQNIIVN